MTEHPQPPENDTQAQEPVEAAPTTTVAEPVSLPELTSDPTAGQGDTPLSLDAIGDVGVEVAAIVGARRITLEQLLQIQVGSVLELDRAPGDPIELVVDGRTVARAEVVQVDGQLGVRIVEVLGRS